MKTKSDIVENWLPRYTGMEVDKFGKYILLTNFSNYLEYFAESAGVEIVGREDALHWPKKVAGILARSLNVEFKRLGRDEQFQIEAA